MLHHATLHLARSEEFPEGSIRHGYEITAPLDREGVLVHRPGGAGGATWRIDDNLDFPGDEGTGYHLHRHRFVAGESVTIQDDDEKPHRFEAVTARPTGHAAVAEGG